MPILQAKKILWFLSPILKLLGGWKMLLIILIKGIAAAEWRRGTCGGVSITDQITDQNTPYCYELGTTAINKIGALDAC